jgi:hypothetical protein
VHEKYVWTEHYPTFLTKFFGLSETFFFFFFFSFFFFFFGGGVGDVGGGGGGGGVISKKDANILIEYSVQQMKSCTRSFVFHCVAEKQVRVAESVVHFWLE